MDGSGIHVKDGWIILVKGIEEVLHRHVDLDIERLSSPSEKGILFTEVGNPAPKASRGSLHGKRVIDELLAAHSTQVTACLGEVHEHFSLTQGEDARENLGRKRFKSGAKWHAEGREVDGGGEMDQGVRPTLIHMIYRRLGRK
jgi:hypothetical protein